MQRRQSLIAVAVLLSLSAIVFAVLECDTTRVVDTFGRTSAEQASAVSADSFERVVKRLEQQSAQYSTWAYAAVVGIVAISVVKKVLAIPAIRWAYVLIGPAATFLLQSLRAGVLFTQRVTFLAITPSLTSEQFDQIQQLLGIQFKALEGALVVMMLFIVAFVASIVSGAADPTGTLPEAE